LAGDDKASNRMRACSDLRPITYRQGTGILVVSSLNIMRLQNFFFITAAALARSTSFPQEIFFEGRV
jgi:hypothetical protein